MNEEFPEYEKNPPSALMREVYDWIESGVMAIVCVILIFTFIGRLVGVVGESMLGTLQNQERLVVSSFFYKPKNGDIVVASKPNDRNEPLLKRVIAVGGQTLDIDYAAGKVIVDGVALEENYILEPMNPAIRGDTELPVTVPEGYVFLMGDNRNSSWDSRYQGVGVVDERHILGKVVYRVMPFSAIGSPYRSAE